MNCQEQLEMLKETVAAAIHLRGGINPCCYVWRGGKIKLIEIHSDGSSRAKRMLQQLLIEEVRGGAEVVAMVAMASLVEVKEKKEVATVKAMAQIGQLAKHPDAQNVAVISYHTEGEDFALSAPVSKMVVGQWSRRESTPHQDCFADLFARARYHLPQPSSN